MIVAYLSYLISGILALVFFLVGISMVSAPGFYIFQIFDDYSVSLPLLVVALFQTIAVSWVYGNDRFVKFAPFFTYSILSSFYHGWLDTKAML